MSELGAQIRVFAESQGYSRTTRFNYICAFNRIYRYHVKHETTVFSEELSWKFVVESSERLEAKQIGIAQFQYTYKVHEMLKALDDSNGIIYNRTENWSCPKLNQGFSNVLDDFLSKRLQDGIAERTIVGNKS